MSYNNVLLIDEDLIKSESIVNDNLNGQAITPAIVISQEVGLQSVIGTRLLRKIQQLVADNQITLEENEKYKSLLDDYITPYLLNKVCGEIMTNVSYKIRQAGVISVTDEKIQTIQYSNLIDIKNMFDNKASHYSIILVNYLKHNSKDYKEFTKALCYEMRGDYDFENCPVNLDISGDDYYTRRFRFGNYYGK